MVNNSAGNDGGAISFYGSSPSFVNNTIANNNSGHGGGMSCFNTSNPLIKNCIFSANTATVDGAQVYLDDEPSDPNFVFCNIFGGTGAFGLNGNFYTGSYTNNINASPVFVSPSAGSGTGFNGLTANWSLQLTSPCINTGDPSGSYPSFDIAGNPRVTGGTIDMGAYEYSTITSIKSNRNDAQLVIYPNPFITSAKIKLNKSISGQLIIYNQAGQKVTSLTVSTSNEIIIERADLISGFYIFVLTSIEGVKYSGKLIIE